MSQSIDNIKKEINQEKKSNIKQNYKKISKHQLKLSFLKNFFYALFLISDEISINQPKTLCLIRNFLDYQREIKSKINRLIKLCKIIIIIINFNFFLQYFSSLKRKKKNNRKIFKKKKKQINGQMIKLLYYKFYNRLRAFIIIFIEQYKKQQRRTRQGCNQKQLILTKQCNLQSNRKHVRKVLQIDIFFSQQQDREIDRHIKQLEFNTLLQN
ncbi:hypothetical protein ABPG74_018058 [Tetrahymena malaccensis]